MAKLIESQNCLSAWKEACLFILNNGDGFNLIVHIPNPGNVDDNHLNEIINSRLISKVDVQNVINTIFPYNFYLRCRNQNLNHFYDLHETLYTRGKRLHTKNRSRWGNYFLRFTKFGINKENQLQNIIDDINNRQNNRTACY